VIRPSNPLIPTLLLAPLTLLAQQPTPPPQIPLRAQANLVLLDVTVTINQTPMHGLPKDRFHLTDNGRPQQITIFEEHKPSDAPAIVRPPYLGPNTYSNLPQFTVGAAANVLLLDALNTPVADQQFVRSEMIKYLRNIPPGTPIAIFTLASRLRMLQGFTADASTLASLLKGKNTNSNPSAILNPQFDQQTTDQANGMAAFGADANAIAGVQQFQADLASFQTDLRVDITLDAMQTLARYLNHIPGRKNLIWFSGSFPLSIEPDASLQVSSEASRNYSDQLRTTDALLATARVAVYPVDARGLMPLPSTTAANDFSSGNMTGPMSATSGRSGRGRPPASSSAGASDAAIKADAKFLRQTEVEHDSMRQIAEETGGHAFLDTNGIKQAVASVVANGSSYYTIGYTPDFKKNDGSFHHLNLTVDGGFQTSYRRGYFADDPAHSAIPPQSPQTLLTSAATQGAPPISDILFKVRVQPADPDPNPTPTATPAPADTTRHLLVPTKRYALDYGIPARPLAFDLTPDGVHHAHLEFVIVAYNADGKRLNMLDQNADLTLPPDLYAKILKTGVPMHLEIDLPTGQVYLRVVVHDLENARLGALEIPLTIPK
jgi:VWFA-related protein